MKRGNRTVLKPFNSFNDLNDIVSMLCAPHNILLLVINKWNAGIELYWSILRRFCNERNVLLHFLCASTLFSGKLSACRAKTRALGAKGLCSYFDWLRRDACRVAHVASGESPASKSALHVSLIALLPVRGIFAQSTPEPNSPLPSPTFRQRFLRF